MKLLAFLNILGFKDIVKYNSHGELRKIYQIFEKSYQNAISLKRYQLTSNGLIPGFENSHVEAIQISDSIILWSKNDSIRSYYDLIIIVRELLFHGIYSGLPLRACIHYGEMETVAKSYSKSSHITTNTLYGEGITTAYQNCENQVWSGGYISKNAINAYKTVHSSFHLQDREIEERIKQLTDFDNLPKRYFITHYSVPLKDNITTKEFCINWVSYTKRKFNKTNVESAFRKFNKKVEDDDTKSKIRNTLQFLDDCPIRII